MELENTPRGLVYPAKRTTDEVGPTDGSGLRVQYNTTISLAAMAKQETNTVMIQFWKQKRCRIL